MNQAEIDRINAVLDENQKRAAEAIDGAVMIVAGAGAGKTKTLIHRCATMLVSGISPKNILLITFTNKAAEEIKNRLEDMPDVGVNAQYISAGTFHSIMKNWLKMFPQSAYMKRIGLNPEELVILDEADSLSLFKQAYKQLPDDALELCKEYQWTASVFKKQLELVKSKGLTEREAQDQLFDDFPPEFIQILITIWRTYQGLCINVNGVDFNDILLHCDGVLRENPEYAQELSEQYTRIMLDEYQDTNRVQQSIIDRIAKHHGNVCAVGDSKQSIYKFRAADVGIFLEFDKQYKDVMRIELDKNYRSYSEIIRYANAVTANMTEKVTEGMMVPVRNVEEPNDLALTRKVNTCSMVEFASDRDEIAMVVKAIKRDLATGVAPEEIALLYRNRNSRNTYEKALSAAGVRYEVLNDTSLYKSREVKDTIALTRFLVHPYDSMAGLRFLDSTSVGVSAPSTREQMATQGRSVHNILLGRSSEVLKAAGSRNGQLKAHALKLRPFMDLIDEVNACILTNDAPDYIAGVLSEVWEIYLAPTLKKRCERERVDYEAKRQNAYFVFEQVERGLKSGKSIDLIIEDLVLMVEGDSETDAFRDQKIKLMTMHASKGLEFHNVYMVGLDEQTMVGDGEELLDEDIEESRRLMFVAMTRAMKKLTMTWSASKYMYGQVLPAIACRFLSEIERTLNVTRHKVR
ncbi:ATP-dependent helicase [Vibrio breoganii]